MSRGRVTLASFALLLVGAAGVIGLWLDIDAELRPAESTRFERELSRPTESSFLSPSGEAYRVESRPGSYRLTRLVGGGSFDLPAPWEKGDASRPWVAYGPDKAVLFHWSGTQGLIFWDLASAKELYRITDAQGGVNDFRMDPTNRIIGGGLGGDSVSPRFWDVETGSLLSTVRRPKANTYAYPYLVIAIHPAGRLAVVQFGDDFWLCDITTGDVLRSVSLPRDRNQSLLAAFSPDGSTLVTRHGNYGPDQPSRPNLAFWDTGTWEMRLRTDIPDTAPQGASPHHAFEFSPDGTLLLLKDPYRPCLLDVRTGRQIRALARDSSLGSIGALRFTADGKAVFALHEKGRAVWRVRSAFSPWGE